MRIGALKNSKGQYKQQNLAGSSSSTADNADTLSYRSDARSDAHERMLRARLMKTMNEEDVEVVPPQKKMLLK